MRTTPGNSFGPMAISATTAMTTSSLQPVSNSAKNPLPQGVRPPACPASRLAAILPQDQCFAAGLPQAGRKTFAGSNDLAADVGPGRRRRCGIVVDGLDRLGLFRGLVVVLHALLEGLD